ncbi:MAG TPA: glycosyltransferase family 4 protein [Candidatus Eremiobacteraceae bacterium]|nr:glycosyltransferase family 4 protein [Candidatus Eremiobacteraceae bacterium]
MPCVAYLVNVFPSSVEPYVIEEIQELRKWGITVIPCSVRRPSPQLGADLTSWAQQTLYIEPLRFRLLVHAGWLCLLKFARLSTFVRALSRRSSNEPRLRALLHTFLGVYYGLLLRDRGVGHIHVHHGYFGSWLTMVAAQVLEIPFSMTLHGSDLLVHAAYLDIKLRQCQFCVTVSEFNRRHIIETYSEADPGKIHVRRLGIDCRATARLRPRRADTPLLMLAVGRLHPVKDHAFLVRACRLLKSRGLKFTCSIVGEGPERPSLEKLIRALDLEREVRLLGGLAHGEISEQYERSDLVVLTSRSEGIPLVLMEAMARGTLVLAPAITGIPELVVDGRTGFLYQPGSMDAFVAQVELINSVRCGLTDLRRNARQHVFQHFNCERNVLAFCELLLSSLRARAAKTSIAA